MNLKNKLKNTKYTEKYIVLNCEVYPKAFIEIYRTEDDALIRSIPIKWEKQYEAFKDIYNKYIKNLNKK